MAKANNQWERAAAAAASNIDAARAMGQQLDLLPAEPDTGSVAGAVTGGRGKGKASATKLREWLALKGYRMPEEVLARIAGLTGADGALVEAMNEAEVVLAWASKGSDAPPAMRMAVFMQLYTAKLRALDALLPYGLAKITPDAGPVQAVQVVVQGGSTPSQPAAGPDQARDVTPRPSRLAPPPMPWEMQQNQAVAEAGNGRSDGVIRTDGASD